MRLIPNVSPEAFSFSAVIIGYLLIDDTTANEQNALGNWLMLIAQVLCTNAFFQQVQAERGNFNVQNNSQNVNSSNISNEETIILLQKMVNYMQKEINDLKNKTD